MEVIRHVLGPTVHLVKYEKSGKTYCGRQDVEWSGCISRVTCKRCLKIMRETGGY